MPTAAWQVEDLGHVANRACWALFAVTALTVCLRIVSRTIFKRGPNGGLGLDDGITVFCVVIMLVTCVLITIGCAHGLGQHMDTLQPNQISQALRWNVIINCVLVWTFSLPKFAIIAILKRILNYGTKTAVVFWFLALTSQACILATSVWWWKQCTPVERGWDKTVPGSCAPISVLANLGYFTSAYSAFLDIVFALYPIPFVMRLNMRLKSRIAVSVALGLSALACIVSIYKLAIFGDIFVIMETDPTYPVPYLDVLGLAEGAILLICASLPTLGPMLRLFSERRTAQNSSNSKGSSGVSGGEWSTYKGQKLDDAERGSVSNKGMLSSVDDIPLVSRSEAQVERSSHNGAASKP